MGRAATRSAKEAKAAKGATQVLARGSAGAGPTATTAAKTAATTNPAIDEEGRFTGAGARGLTFVRRWTTPGIHPYDEVTW
ncbi:MAG: hypothetical protein H0V04_05705, partial [Chloroflexi bacterium]|nr:hypothetical protein [Chloroflexota bacterium]